MLSNDILFTVMVTVYIGHPSWLIPLSCGWKLRDRPTGFESGEIIVFGNEMSVHDLQIFASNETHMSNVHPLYVFSSCQ